MRSLSYGNGELNNTMRSATSLESQCEILDHRSAEIAADEHRAVVTQVIVHECVQVARVRGHVVEAVGRDVGVAEATQVRNDDLEAGVGERLDHAPPDALRLGPAVDQQQRPRAAGFSCTNACVKPRTSVRWTAYRVGSMSDTPRYAFFFALDFVFFARAFRGGSSSAPSTS